MKAREQIRQFLVDGKITMEAKEDGSWAAHFKYFPTLLLEAQNGNSPGPKSEKSQTETSYVTQTAQIQTLNGENPEA